MFRSWGAIGSQIVAEIEGGRGQNGTFFGWFHMEWPICKYHFLCFVTIIQVKVISGHQVKKVKQKNSCFRAAMHVFRSSQRTRIDPKTLLKRQNRPKNKIRKITLKSQNDVKSACFWHVLCYISAIFEDIDLNFFLHIFMRHCRLTCYLRFFFNFDLGETVLKRKKIGHFLFFSLKFHFF